MFSKVLGKERARMKNRSSYAVLTRFGILGALLATLAFIAPVVFANAVEVDFPEDQEDLTVETFSATDADAMANIEWDLSGVDADAFEIDGGVLSFKEAPNYESPTDADEDTDTSGDQGKGDNVYKVTVIASGTEQDVEVTVINVDEPGSVTFTQLQAQATRDLTAKYSDDDSPKDATWQWSRGPSEGGPWTPITGATSADREPTEDDIGSWLQATVSYTDSFGAQTASGEIGPVVEETLSNAPPSFGALDDDENTAGVQIEREVNEGTKGNIGDPLAAKDDDGDPRLYTITGGADEDCFSIDEKSGQLSLNAERDFEMPLAACETGGTARPGVGNTNNTEDSVYTVEITATDPSGATGTATVTVTVKDVNEAAEFVPAAKAEANVTLYIDENETFTAGATGAEDLALRQNEADRAETAADDGTNVNPTAYTATDEDDDTALDANTNIRYSVEGADAKHFDIGETNGELTFMSGDDLLGADGADFETKNSYSITIVATSGGTTTDADGPVRTVEDVDRTRYTTLAVTIKVVDQEDLGEVEIDMAEPQEGKSVLATLSDKDGGVTGVTWQWSRIAALEADGDGDGEPDPVRECADVEDIPGTPARTWADIDGATSPIYTPASDTFDHDGDGDEAADVSPEVGYCLRATATYTDDIANPADDDTTTDVDESMDTAMASPTRRVQKDDPANAAPEFNDDQDPNTPGKQAVAERTVAENVKGTVGEPVVADDVDLLVYSVDDMDNFNVSNMGQISTAVELDYESLPDDAKYYMVTLTATDPSGAVDTIMVKITVTDANDNAVISGDDEVSVDEGTTAVAMFSATDEDADAGDIAWDLSGVDAGAFEISDDGELTFEDSPNYESPTDADEDGDTSGDQGKGDNVYKVTVTASGGEHAVEVTVINVDEPGNVSFTQLQAQATRDLEAKYSDDDNPKDPTWQWSRGDSAEGPWTAITGATSADRKPTGDDIGSWLQATVSYTDSFGAQTASGEIGPVTGETLANAAPSFSDLDDDEEMDGVQIELEVNEDTKGDIDDPLAATDANGDPRLYTITGGADEDCFSIDEKSGQLSLNAERDFEMPLAACETGGTARPGVGNTNNTEDSVYTVEITATDPSGATGTATVTVTVKDVNEAAEFVPAAKAEANVTLYIDENETFTAGATGAEDLALRQNEADRAETAADDGTNVNPTAYTATDEDDDTALDANTNIRYSVEGADAKHFDIGETNGELTFMSGDDLLGADGADFETKNSYSITIVATSGGTTTDADGPVRTVEDVDRTRYTTLAVTIKVVDQEDLGEVKIDMPEPQEGKSVLATLSDKDGGITGLTWQWSRIAALGEDGDDTDTDPDPVRECDDVDTTLANVAWADIDGATSPIYTPASYTFDHDNVDTTDEVGYCLRATATYTDDIANPADDDTTTDVDESMDTAMMSPTRRVQKDDPANTAPEFAKDQDPNMPGNQEVAERTIAENVKGPVGAPVVAKDDDLLMYTVDDMDNFSVDNMGQISTAVELDYEALPEDAKYHMVTLMATDPSGAVDTIMVKITVTDADDKPVITLGPATGGTPDPTHPCVEGGAVAADAGANLANDCQILLDGRDELVGDGTALNWSADEPIENWNGVSSRSGTSRVYSIYLRGHGLAGEIPDGFNGLDALESLQLHDNMLTGDIPDLSDLDVLERLVLSDNMLSGSVPATLGDMAELDILRLQRNDLSGEIPAELGNATRLRHIWLHGNGLTGEIPAELGNLSDRLRYLVLSSNMLTGEIPAELGNAIHLKQIYLHNNMLTGMIPAELGSIMDDSGTLRRLYLNNNMLTGMIPAELGNLSDLDALRLSGNMLEGCVPADIFGAVDDGLDLMACEADDES